MSLIIRLVLAIEAKWANEESRKRLLKLSAKVEEQDSLMEMRPHILGIAKKV